MTVIIPEGGSDATAVAAGEAKAEAAHAVETAEEAGEVAGMAEAVAGTAVETADAAASVAWDARTEVDALREEFRSGFADLQSSLAASRESAAPAETETAEEVATVPVKESEPEVKDKDKAESSPDKADSTTVDSNSYGSRTWFGGR